MAGNISERAANRGSFDAADKDATESDRRVHWLFRLRACIVNDYTASCVLALRAASHDLVVSNARNLVLIRLFIIMTNYLSYVPFALLPTA